MKNLILGFAIFNLFMPEDAFSTCQTVETILSVKSIKSGSLPSAYTFESGYFFEKTLRSSTMGGVAGSDCVYESSNSAGAILLNIPAAQKLSTKCPDLPGIPIVQLSAGTNAINPTTMSFVSGTMKLKANSSGITSGKCKYDLKEATIHLTPVN